MTLCELATARHHVPPLECAPFAKGQVPSDHTQPECVEALSRSAQFWSSYSGYLREIPQLCFAFRRWSDIDVAKDIYRNITTEKLALVRFLTEREKNAVATQRSWVQANQDLQGILVTLQSTSSWLRGHSDSVITALNQSIQSLFADMHSVLQEIQHRDRVDMLTKLNAMLADIGHEHSANLALLVPSIRSSIISELNTAFDIIKHEGLRNVDAADHVHRQLDMVADGLTMMQSTVDRLVGLVSDTSVAIEVFVAQAQAGHALQQQVLASTFQMIDTVNLLTQTTHHELESINQTTAALVDGLRRGHDWDWYKTMLITVLRLWPGISGINPDLADTSRSLPILFGLIAVVWRLVCFSTSMFTSVFLLANAGRWMSVRPRAVPMCDSPVDMAHATMDLKPVLVQQFPNRRAYESRRSYRPRYSRIPDRLCIPVDHAAWP
ncbi:hypothetical protein J3A83DRAFT_4228864 [Scleroderma citrinum]